MISTLKANLKRSAGKSLFAALLVIATPLSALDINTGEEDGAYHKIFCPAIGKAISDLDTSIKCQTSNGSEENLKRVLANPKQMGFSQFDVYSLQNQSTSTEQNYIPIRTDLARECLFMVTKGNELLTFDDVSKRAQILNFVLPPKGSGSARTFSYLQTIDPEGLGKAANIRHTATTKDAIIDSLLDENSVTLFVAFPDATNDKFRAVNANEGHFIPVINRQILHQKSGNRKIYFAEDTQVKDPSLSKQGKSLTTSCTPVVLFTGASALNDEAGKKLIAKLEGLPRETIAPEKTLTRQLWNSSKQLSATAVEKLLKMTDNAKKSAGPAMEKAKELGAQAIEKSKPALEKAKELSKDALETSKPALEKAKELGKDALKAAKPWYEKAKQKAKEYLSEPKDSPAPAPQETPAP